MSLRPCRFAGNSKEDSTVFRRSPRLAVAALVSALAVPALAVAATTVAWPERTNYVVTSRFVPSCQGKKLDGSRSLFCAHGRKGMFMNRYFTRVIHTKGEGVGAAARAGVASAYSLGTRGLSQTTANGNMMIFPNAANKNTRVVYVAATDRVKIYRKGVLVHTRQL